MSFVRYSAIAMLLGCFVIAIAAAGAPVRDGSSPDSAVIIDRPQRSAVAEEWRWIITHYPDASLLPDKDTFVYSRDTDLKTRVSYHYVAFAFMRRDGARRTIYFTTPE